MVDTGTKTGKVAFAAALAAVVIGVCVLAGWLFELEFLKRIAPGLVAMNPATAVAFVLAGASLALFLQSPHGRDQKSRALILTARLCALVVALIGLAKLVGILCGWDLGVDRWLFASKLPDGLRFPNRIAPNTALNFLLFGSALLLVDVKNRSVRFCVEFSVVVVGFGSLLAVLAYAYDIQSFYGLGAFIPMALHTAITFSVLIVAFLLSHTDSGLLAVFAGDSAGGTMARRLLPAAVLVPAGLGWLTLQGEQAGIYHGEFGEAVFAVGNILVFTFLVCWSAKGLFSAELERRKTNEALQAENAERKRAEETLRESEEKFRQLAENITDVFWMTSPDMRKIHYVSPAYERVWGRSMESLHADPNQWVEAILPEERERTFAALAGLGADNSNVSVEYRISRPDGTVRWIHDRGFVVRDAAGNVIRHTGIATDITERKRLEAQLFQSQKMETVGKLAGGIAHEFNSILTAIIGQSELLLGDLPAGSPLAKNATEISKAAGRAATLTRQLLAYGRKQLLQPETLDLNQVIASMEGMFHHLMGGDVDTQIVPAPGLQAVKADAGQIEQVIMNMAINARDAMPNGGKLTLETANVSFDQESVGRYPELKPGDYVMLAITDTGTGMSEEVKARAVRAVFFHQRRWPGDRFGIVHLLRHHQTKRRSYQRL